MTRYIGLDAHSESCTATVMGPSGRRLGHERLTTDSATLKKFVRTVPRPRYLRIEEGNLSEWLYEELEPLVDELVVVQPSKHQGHKSDLADAWKLADEQRRGELREPVYKNPGSFRELREAVRTYDVLRRDSTRCKSRLNALCRARGLQGAGPALYTPESRHEVLVALPEHYRERAGLWCEQLDGVTDCVRQAERWLQEAAGRVPVVKRLATAPGIGLVRASYIVAIVVSPHRFRTSRQFWSYCGLAIVTRSSSDWERDRHGDWRRKKMPQTRGLNRNRHPLLKNVFKGAAMHIVAMPDHPLGQAYQRLLKTTKPNLARLTIARRLAAAVLAMWKNKEDYDPNKHCDRS